MEFEIWVDGEHDSDEEAETAKEALESAIRTARADMVGQATREGSTIWFDIKAVNEDGDETERRSVPVHPKAPRCSSDQGHRWRNPIELVGGIEENPGVQGHGGGVLIAEVCVRCGCGKLTDTWAQRRDTGEQGLESIRYEADRYDVSGYEDFTETAE